MSLNSLYARVKVEKAISAYQQFPCQETLEHIAVLVNFYEADIPDEIMAELILEGLLDE